TSRNLDVLRHMRDDEYELRALCSGGLIDLEQLGKALYRGWAMKRRLASGISTGDIDDYYERAIAAGAEGGRLCGAGGGGFLLFVVKPEKRQPGRPPPSPPPPRPPRYHVHRP